MSTFEVIFADSRLGTLPPARAAEWNALGRDLAEAVTSLDGRDGAWIVHSDGGRFAIEGGGERIAIDRTELDPLFEEYLDVVSRLGSADTDGFSRMDALDMAKKVTHDRAGRVLKRQLRPLAVDHEVARRVFSLLAALAFDTSALTGMHAALAVDPANRP